MSKKRESGGITKFEVDCEVLDMIEVHALSDDLHIHSKMSTDDAMAICRYHVHTLVNKYRKFKNSNRHLKRCDRVGGFQSSNQQFPTNVPHSFHIAILPNLVKRRRYTHQTLQLFLECQRMNLQY